MREVLEKHESSPRVLSCHIQYYKMFRCMRAPRLVRTSSLYFHKARALRHTRALWRYNARCVRHQYERAQLTIHFIKEITKRVPRDMLSFISAWKFLRTLEKCLRLVLLQHLSRVLKNSRVVYPPVPHLF